jgi:hypothetical protein
MIKVVYNNRYGGFSISEKCAKYMSDHGCKHAQDLLKRYDEELESERCWYGYWQGDRHDPLLVEAVEWIGFGSGADDGEHADSRLSREPQLQIAEVTSGRYFIREYDGGETVIEPQDIDWIVVQS